MQWSRARSGRWMTLTARQLLPASLGGSSPLPLGAQQASVAALSSLASLPALQHCARSRHHLHAPQSMEDHTLFGYPLPFPREDLVVALIAVFAFIPAVVLLNALVHGVMNLFSPRGKTTKTQ